MNSSVQSIRKAIHQHITSRRGRSRRYPRAVRAAAIAIAERGRRDGVPLSRTARRLGLHSATLYLWVSRQPARLLPVAVTSAPALTRELPEGRPVLVTPQGYRIEGLDAAQLASLLRALS